MINWKRMLVSASLMCLMMPGGIGSAESKVIEIGKLPQSASEIPASFKNPYDVAAYSVAAFIRYTENVAEGEAMLNKLKGPEPLNPFGKQFLRDRLRGKEYVARSYIMGTSPENGYAMQAPYAIKVESNPYSFQEAHYARLLLTSSGADNPRWIVLREKASTGEWFLWTYEGVLADIRPPKGASAWD
ncbi:MAG: hypothetical protein MJ055_04730 [Phascolarctobacterium sp.]|nr:hypothetical protein [Phascolarctobacterium sp.]